MSNSKLAITAVIVTVGLIVLIYVAVTYEGTTDTMQTETVEPELTETAPSPEPEAEPEPEPVPAFEPEPLIAPPEQADEEDTAQQTATAEEEPEPEPLPPLSESDDFVLSRLAELEPGERLLRAVVSDEVVRRFVILVENVSRGIIPQRDLPLQRDQGPLEVRPLDEGERYVMEPSSYERFDALIDTFMAVETAQAVELYQALSPLFQQALAEMGYPRRDFDDVMIEAIDEVLDASIVEGPFELERPSVMYRYTDEEIENLNAVEKQLIRLGPENAERLQRKLREFRQALLQAQQASGE